MRSSTKLSNAPFLLLPRTPQIAIGTTDPLCIGYLCLDSLTATEKHSHTRTQALQLSTPSTSCVFKTEKAAEVRSFVGAADGAVAFSAVLLNVTAPYTRHAAVAKEVLDNVVAHADPGFELVLVGATGSSKLVGDVFEVQANRQQDAGAGEGRPQPLASFGFPVEAEATLHDGLLAAFVHLSQAMGIPCRLLLAEGNSGLFRDVSARVDAMAQGLAAASGLAPRQTPLLEAARTFFTKDVDADFPHMYM